MKEVNETLATEMLRELKANSKRWFIIAIIELVVILAGGIAFVTYLSLPDEETEITYTQDADTQGDSSPIEQHIGG